MPQGKSEHCPTDLVTFRLIQIARKHKQKADKLLNPLGIYPGQEIVLLALFESDGLSITEIGQTHRVSAPTLTKMTDRLMQAGLVEKRPDAADQRVTRIFLTDRAHEARGAVESLWPNLEKDFLGPLSQEERQTLERLLIKIAAGQTDGPLDC